MSQQQLKFNSSLPCIYNFRVNSCYLLPCLVNYTSVAETAFALQKMWNCRKRGKIWEISRFPENEGQLVILCLTRKAFGRTFQRCNENCRSIRLGKFAMQVAGALYFVIVMIKQRTPLGVKYSSVLFAQCGFCSCSCLSLECGAFLVR